MQPRTKWSSASSDATSPVKHVGWIDFIRETRHLSTRLRIDGIKAMSRSFSGGKQVIKKYQYKKSLSCLFILDDRK